MRGIWAWGEALPGGNFRASPVVDIPSRLRGEIPMTTRKSDVTKRRSPSVCRHPQRYETDWLRRTYMGCPICNRWKRMKAKPAPADGKRLAA